jgi:hypothetical protein
VGFSRPPESKPWSFNYGARPFIFITALFLVALALGFLLRWVGLGRRTT